MVINPVLIVILLLALSASLLTVAYIYHLYLGERHKKNRGIFSSLPPEKALIQAQSKAEGIIERAVGKAEKTLLDTEYIRQQLISESEEKMGKAAEKILASLDEEGEEYHKQFGVLFENVRSAYISKVDESLKIIEEATIQELKDVHAHAQARTQESDEKIQQKVQEELEATKLAVSDYKKQQLKKVDDSINSLILKVIEDVSGRVIPLAEHEKIVFEALEAAKHENVFYGMEVRVEEKEENTSKLT